MADSQCGDIFCKGCDMEVRRRNQFLEAEVRDLEARLTRKTDLQSMLDQARVDLHEARQKLDRQDELLYLYRTAQTAKKAMDVAELTLEQNRASKRARGEM
jgi:hypothetical protein